MKRVLPITLLWLATSAGPAHAAAARGTAEWVQANLSTLVGERVTLYVAYCSPGNLEGDEQWYSLYTPAGYINAVMPASESKSFFNRIGSESRGSYNLGGYSVKTKNVSGTIRLNRSGVAYLDLRSEEKEVTEAATSSRTRTWTSADGRTIEAEYLSASSTHVTIRRQSDAVVFTFELAKLSEADREWVAKQR